jgi:hypothetical protein
VLRRTRAIAEAAAQKMAGVSESNVSTGMRRVQTAVKASGCTPADVFAARRRDDGQGSNSSHVEMPDLPFFFGTMLLPEAERSLRAAPRCAVPACPPRPDSITSSR